MQGTWVGVVPKGARELGVCTPCASDQPEGLLEAGYSLPRASGLSQALPQRSRERRSWWIEPSPGDTVARLGTQGGALMAASASVAFPILQAVLVFLALYVLVFLAGFCADSDREKGTPAMAPAPSRVPPVFCSKTSCFKTHIQQVRPTWSETKAADSPAKAGGGQSASDPGSVMKTALAVQTQL